MDNSTSDSPQLKRCSTCRESKPAEQFARNRCMRDGRANVCKACMKGYQSKNYQGNRQEVLAKAGAYYAANRTQVRARHRLYGATHQAETKARNDSWRARHPGRKTALANARRAVDPTKSRAAVSAYHAKKRGAQVSDFTAVEWQAMKSDYQNRCAYCGKSGLLLEQDHVKPLSRGGDHTASNIVPACRKCNAFKRARTPEEAGMRFVVEPKEP